MATVSDANSFRSKKRKINHQTSMDIGQSRQCLIFGHMGTVLIIILLKNRKLTDIGRRSMSAVGQYRTVKQDKWKRPLSVLT